MKLFVVILFSVFVLSTVNGSITEAVVKNCKVTATQARVLVDRVSPFVSQSLEGESGEELSANQVHLLQDIISVVPGSQNTQFGKFLFSDASERFDSSELLYGFGDLLPGLRPGGDQDANAVDPVSTPAPVLDDWDECGADMDYYLSPILEAAVCAATTTLVELVPALRLPLKLAGHPKRPDLPMNAWAFKMIDASFKPPPGLMAGKLHWPGDYEMCLDIESNYSTTAGFRTVQGGYCRVNIGGKSENASLSVALGVCVPKTCTTSNITDFINSGDVTFGLLDKIGMEVKSIDCGRELVMATDERGQIALGITLSLAIIAILAGIYDGMLRKYLIQKDLDKNYVPVQKQFAASPAEDHVAPSSRPVANGSPAVTAKGTNISYVTVHPEDHRRYSMDANAGIPTVSIPLDTNNDKQVIYNRPAKFTPKVTTSYLDEPASLCDRLEVAFVGFSALNSMKNIFMPRLGRDHFRSCDAIRFLSYCYAMLGMTWILGIIYTETFTTGNLLFKLMELRKVLYFQPVINFTLCTNSFLVLSGLLVTYKWLKKVAENDGKMSFGMFIHYYLHRYWSLMPAFMLVTMFYTCLYEYFTHGPMVPPQITDAENCRENWWTNLLMINNLVNTDDACMSWTWYIPMVFQLHVITPIILIPLSLHIVAGCVSLVVLFAVNITVAAFVSINLYENFGFHEWYYEFVMVPWTKAGPYFVGVGLGILLFNIKGKQIKMPAVVTVLGWLASIAVVTAVAVSSFPIFSADKEENVPFDIKDFQLDKIQAVLLRTLGHTGWGLAIAWMIFASETGHGGCLRSFLRWKAFGPLARISFMAFLVSAIMIIRNTLMQVSLIYVTLNNMLYFLIGNIVIVMIVGLALGLAFQHPFIGIEKAFTIKTKRDAFLVASNPITDEEEEQRPEVSPLLVPSEKTLYDNIAYTPDSEANGVPHSTLYPELPPEYTANQTTEL